MPCVERGQRYAPSKNSVIYIRCRVLLVSVIGLSALARAGRLTAVQLLGDRRVVLEGVAGVGVRFGVRRLE
eukprot:6134701-Pyramimonas_sp.AAC.1